MRISLQTRLAKVITNPETNTKEIVLAPTPPKKVEYQEIPQNVLIGKETLSDQVIAAAAFIAEENNKTKAIMKGIHKHDREPFLITLKYLTND